MKRIERSNSAPMANGVQGVQLAALADYLRAHAAAP